MPRKTPPPAPRKPAKKIRLVTQVDQELLDALNRYCVAQPYGADRAAVVRTALRDLLAAAGFWP